jgi:arginase family enzyme
VQTDPGDVVRKLHAWADGHPMVSVHVDVDVLDQTEFPSAEEQRDTAG